MTDETPMQRPDVQTRLDDVRSELTDLRARLDDIEADISDTADEWTVSTATVLAVVSSYGGGERVPEAWIIAECQRRGTDVNEWDVRDALQDLMERGDVYQPNPRDSDDWRVV